MAAIQGQALKIMIREIQGKAGHSRQGQGILARVAEPGAAGHNGKIRKNRVIKLCRQMSCIVLQGDNQGLCFIILCIGRRQPCQPGLALPDFIAGIAQLSGCSAISQAHLISRGAVVQMPPGRIFLGQYIQ